ncbi:MAG: NAD(P)-binding protein [Myxococcales bacterium]|nr:NAD(P)-binding protein [Myxococcales bacterium]
MAALTTAFELSSEPGWRDRYDITVYQMGHRLGGKGASGRNRERFDRIEEHGLHLFYGFYDNAFGVMRRCYEELGRPADAPLATVEDAFKPHSLVVFEEERQGKWQHQPLLFPRNAEVPGSGERTPTPAELIPRMLRFLLALYDEQPALRAMAADIAGAAPKAERRSTSAAMRALRAGVERLLAEVGEFLQAPASGLVVVRREELLARLLACSRWAWRVLAPLLAGRPELRIAWVAADITLAMIRGMIADRLVEEDTVDWLRLDHEDFRAWLRRHGASEEAANASTVAGVYAGAYMAHQDIGAGTALHWTLRMLYTYRGSIFYKMQAGMGDVIFAPLYEVLRRRGVKFAFFHRADALRLAADRSRVEEVEFGRQMLIKDGREYAPLYDVKGLPCWPSEPLYEQLVNGDELKDSGEHLEDWGTRWPDQADKLVLRAGRDFDRVILGIGVGAVPALCQEMLRDAGNPRFAAMVAAIKTTPTASAQLWFRGDLKSTGWHLPPPVMIPYADPLDTWADMSHLLPRETFPASVPAGSCAYLTAAMLEASPHPVTREEWRGHAARETARVASLTREFVRDSSAHLWPAAQRRGGGGLDAAKLVDPDGGDALAWQHYSPVHNPSDRYVRSVRGSAPLRLDPGASGYDNLVLCGDWTQNPMNLGCVEGATMSGIRAAQVVSGRAIALHDDWLAPRRGEPRPGPARARPRYIERALNESTSPPYEARQTAMYAAVLRAEPEKLLALCDRHLGWGPTRRYLPLGPSAVFYAQHNHALSAVDAPGVVPERDFGFLIPVAVCERRSDGLVPVGVAVYMPYLWVDLGAAVLGGREVLGFPKGQARLQFPGRGDPGVALRVDAWMPPASAGRDQPWREERLISATTVPGAQDGGVRSLADALRAGYDAAWLARCGIGLGGQLQLLRALTGSLRTGGLRMVFLKQYRDAALSDRACYQAIVEAPCVREATRVATRVPGSLQLQVLRRAGLVAELGLHSDGGDATHARVPALATFYTELDFTIGAGDVVFAA